MGFVADLVAGALGSELTEPISDDTTPVPFVVDTRRDRVRRRRRPRRRRGSSASRSSSSTRPSRPGPADTLQAGTYELNRAMTPQEILAALQDAPVLTISVGLREGLRLEQIAAYLQTIGIRPEAASEFYDLAREPTAELRADYPFLETLPEGRSLEGYLAAGTYEVLPVRDRRGDRPSPARRVRPTARGVRRRGRREGRQARLLRRPDPGQHRRARGGRGRRTGRRSRASTPNRLDPERWATGLLESDPTVFYGWDSLQLGDRDFEAWPDYRFWAPPGKPLKEIQLPDRLASFQTYQQPGLPEGPIATPTMASIKAALEPDTKNRYLFFVLKNDGSRTHAFAKTFAEHEANLRKYGYQ